MRKLLSNLPSLLKLAYQGWNEDDASRLSAALAYYTIFSLAPLLIIVIAVTGLIWESSAIRAQILGQVQELVGAEGADFIAGLITNTGSPGEGILALLLGILTLLLGALGVFNQLHTSLNIIWNVKEEKPKGLLPAIKKVLVDRFLSFTMILGIGFLLLVSLVITAGLSAAQQTLGNAFPLSEFIWQIVNLTVSIGVIAILFALMFKFVPDIEIAWGDVWIGGLITAVLFSLGKMVIGIYLGNSAVSSTFGAAGSLVLLLLWIYYSAQILFFGAEFTQVYANTSGSKPAARGQETLVRAEAKSAKGLEARPALTAAAAMAISQRENQLEKENRQTARFFLGMLIASFLTGMFTTIFGRRKR